MWNIFAENSQGQRVENMSHEIRGEAAKNPDYDGFIRHEEYIYPWLMSSHLLTLENQRQLTYCLYSGNKRGEMYPGVARSWVGSVFGK